MRFLTTIFALALAASQASAQTKDFKDHLIDAVQAERDDALAKLAIGYATSQVETAKLKAEIAELKAAAEAAKKPSDEPKPDAPAQ